MNRSVTLRFVVMFAATAFAQGASAQSPVPDNATSTFGGGWICNLGYRRVGDRCEKVNVPPNAFATFGGGWMCNLGYRGVGDRCEKGNVAPDAFATLGGGM